MVQRLSRGDTLKIGALPTAERAAGGRYPQAGDFSFRLTEQALVDGAMLGIDGHEGTGRAHRRGRAGRATLRAGGALEELDADGMPAGVLPLAMIS